MVGDNIKKLREELGLTQTKFAERIGIKQNTIAAVESNSRNISRQALKAISREFKVSLEWLETGEGEMFLQQSTAALTRLEEEYNLSTKSRELIENFLKLPPSVRDLVADAVARAAVFYPRKPEADQSHIKPDSELTREEVHAQLDAEWKAKEEAEKRGISTSSASTITSGLSKKSGKNS